MILGKRWFQTAARSDVRELFSFVGQRLTRVHGLHPQNLIVALLVVEHRMREIVKHILRRQRAVRLNIGELSIL